MAVTENMVQEMLKTLPIGYYIGRNIPVEVDTSMTSHYDILNDIIRINTQMIADTLNKIEDCADVEADTRAMLYHELSHAMLTPRCLTPEFHINVIEDARIEHLNRDYFYGVNFNEFNFRYLQDTPNTDVQNAFIRFCKLGELPEDNIDFRNLWDELINMFNRYDVQHLNATTDEYTSDDYKCDCNSLYYTFQLLFNKHQKQEQQQQNQGQSGQNQQGNSKGRGQRGDKSNQSQSGQQNGSKQGQGNSAENTGTNGATKKQMLKSSDGEEGQDGDCQQTISDQEGQGRGNFKLDDDRRKLLNTVASQYEDPALTEKLRVIISNHNQTSARNASAMHAYAGKFDVRAVAFRNDYKYFLKKNSYGDSRGYSNLHFNLFLDQSSSFRRNEEIALTLLKSLCWLEKQVKEFSFTLITCDVGETIVPKKNMNYRTFGGTRLSRRIFDTFKQVQDKHAVNFNIVLYDGEAVDKYSSPGTDGAPSNFAAFNTKNTIIITDPSNAEAVNKYCPSAQKIISKNYTEELISNLLKMLQILLK